MLTQKKIPPKQRDVLSEKLDTLGGDFLPVERAFLSGLLALGGEEIKNEVGDGAIGAVTLEYDPRRVPKLSEALMCVLAGEALEAKKKPV